MKARIALISMVLAAAIVLGMVLHQRKSDDGFDIVKKAYLSSAKATYSGEVVTVSEGKSVRSKVLHSPDAEKIEYLTSPVAGTVVITEDGVTRTYSPRSRHVTVAKDSNRLGIESLLAMLHSNYICYKSGQARIAGVPVEIVSIAPKSGVKPWKKLWIDSKTGLVLKSEDYTSKGALRSRTEFVKLSFTIKNPASIQTKPSFADEKWTKLTLGDNLNKDQIEKATGIDIKTPSYLPKGYVLQNIELYHCPCSCKYIAAHLRYTDGLNSLSVFESKNHSDCQTGMCKTHCAKSGQCEMMSTSEGTLATTSSGCKMVAVVADMPRDEIAKIAQSCN